MSIKHTFSFPLNSDTPVTKDNVRETLGEETLYFFVSEELDTLGLKMRRDPEIEVVSVEPTGDDCGDELGYEVRLTVTFG